MAIEYWNTDATGVPDYKESKADATTLNVPEVVAGDKVVPYDGLPTADFIKPVANTGRTSFEEGATAQEITDDFDAYKLHIKAVGNTLCQTKYNGSIENEFVRREKFHKQLEAAGWHNNNNTPTVDDKPDKQRSADTWELLDDELVRVGGTMAALVSQIKGNADTDNTDFLKVVADFRRKFTLVLAAATTKAGCDTALSDLTTDLATVPARS